MLQCLTIYYLVQDEVVVIHGEDVDLFLTHSGDIEIMDIDGIFLHDSLDLDVDGFVI